MAESFIDLVDEDSGDEPVIYTSAPRLLDDPGFRASVQANIEYDFDADESRPIDTNPVQPSSRRFFPVSSLSRSRGVSALENLNPERYEELYSTSFMWAANTVRKHHWAWDLYTAFCERVGKEPLPYEGRHLGAFVNYLAVDVGYAIGSITDVILPSLKRLHIEKTGNAVPAAIEKFLETAVREARSKIVPSPEHGREASLITDVAAIIHAIPPGYEDKAGEASCFLFSVNTGARAISCANVNVQDIRSVTRSSEDPNMVMVTIVINRTKGLYGWNHSTTLEGTFDEPDDINFVYWLNKYLTERFGEDRNLKAMLQDRQKVAQALGPSPILLWPWKEDALSSRFRRAAEKAGYPAHLLSFHSLRAGFLCSAILLAGSDTNAVKGILEDTAFIAGWKVGGRAQLRYVKDSAIRSIVTNRLVMPLATRTQARMEQQQQQQQQQEEASIINLTDEPVPSNTNTPSSSTLSRFYSTNRPIVRENAAVPTVYHHLEDPLRTSWESAGQVNYGEFHRKAMKYFARDREYMSSRRLFNHKQRLLTRCLVAWAKNDADILAQVETEMDKPYHGKSDEAKREKNLQKQFARKDIIRRLDQDYSKLNEIFNEFVDPVKEIVEKRIILKENKIKKPKKKTVYQKLPRTHLATGARKRVHWSDEEVALLKEKYPLYPQQWKKLEAFFPNRTDGDIKDKWRNLMGA